MYVIADNRVSDVCLARLTGLGQIVIRLPCFKGLSDPVSAHPDLLCYPFGNTLLVCGAYYEENRVLFESFPIPVLPIEVDLTGGYPKDCAMDLLPIGGTLIGGKASSGAIRSLYDRFLPVRQGYVRCSVAMLKENAAITADGGIARALEGLGVDVLLISPGHIALPGYDYGFIGGAGGRLRDGRYAWFGDYRTHPDGGAMEEFALRHGVEMVCLSDGELRDFGGLLAV